MKNKYWWGVQYKDTIDGMWCWCVRWQVCPILEQLENELRLFACRDEAREYKSLLDKAVPGILHRVAKLPY